MRFEGLKEPGLGQRTTVGAAKLHKALDICGRCERKLVMTGRDTGANRAAFGEYIMRIVENPNVEARWDEYVANEAK